MQVCECALVEFTSDALQMHLGRAWDLGPVVVTKAPGSALLSVYVLHETLKQSLISLTEFKNAQAAGGDQPLILKFALDADQGPYGFDEITFADSAACKLVSTRYSMNKMEFIFELLAKGKELCIFNGNSGNAERTGDQKPLFWASVLKRNVH